MVRSGRMLSGALLVLAALGLASTAGAQGLDIAKLYIEYNQTDNDLGFHVFLDGEDWRSVKIVNPNGKTVFEAFGRGPYYLLGLTEMFFEGAEPSLDDVPLATLLGMFPEGNYRFQAVTVDGSSLSNLVKFSHAIPDGPHVATEVDGNEVEIRWTPVSAPPPGFPSRKIKIVGYQVIVGTFQVTLPASARSVEVPEEYVASLGSGAHGFEVLAIDESGNQTITADEFVLD